jgi:hypothetical protein
MKMNLIARLILIMMTGLSLGACVPNLSQPTTTPSPSQTPLPIPTATSTATPTATPNPSEILRIVCQGTAVPDSAAYTYDHSPHQIISSGDFLLPLPEKWQSQTVADTELVLCAQHEEKLIETCNYGGSATVKRYTYLLSIRLVEAQSAEEVANFDLKGSEPNSCPTVIVISGNETVDKEFHGDPVQSDQFLPLLEPYVMASRVLPRANEDFPFATSMAFSSDGRYLAAGLHDVYVWSLDSSQVLHKLQPFQSKENALVQDIVFSPDSNYIAIGSIDEPDASMWEVASGQLFRTFPGDTKGVLKMAFSPDSRTFVVGDMDGKITLWDTSSGNKIQSLKAWFISNMFYSPDGKYLAVGDSAGIALWDVAAGQQSATRLDLEDFPDHLFLAVLPGGKTLASGSCMQYDPYPVCSSGKISFWDMSSGKIVRELPLPSVSVADLFVSPDGSLLATESCIQKDFATCEVSQITLWNMETAEIVTTFQAAGDFYALTFTPDGKSLAVCLFGGNIILYKIPATTDQ